MSTVHLHVGNQTIATCAILKLFVANFALSVCVMKAHVRPHPSLCTYIDHIDVTQHHS